MLDFRLRSGITVSELAEPEFLSRIDDIVAAGDAFHICTLNPEIAERARQDRAYRRAVDSATLRTIDGSGIAVAIFRRYGYLPSRFTGMQVTQALLKWSSSRAGRVMIVGAEEQSRLRAEEVLLAGGMNVVRGASPTVSGVGDGGEELFVRIPPRTAVLVALGAPKQEFWIRRCIASNPAPSVFAGIGGVVDYLSGHAPLPPQWACRTGCEWLWRLARQPGLRAWRQATALPRFVCHEVL